jgi:hypothetical protein
MVGDHMGILGAVVLFLFFHAGARSLGSRVVVSIGLRTVVVIRLRKVVVTRV